MLVKILKAIAGTSWKVGDIVEVEKGIAEAYVAAGYCEESADSQAALENSIQTELTALRAGIAEALRGVVEDVRRGAAPTVTPTESEADRRRSFNDCVRTIGLAQKHRDPEAVERLEKVYKAERVDEHGNVVRAHQGAQGTTGGYLIPPEYATELLKLDAEVAAFADGARTVGMAGDTKLYPALRQTGKNAPAGGSSIHAGIITYYKSERAQRTRSTAEFDQIELKAHDLTAYTESTRDLLADAPGAEGDFMALLRGALAWKIDHVFIRGDGVGKPLGYFDAPATITAPRAEANKILFADAVGMLARLMPECWGKARWIANVTVFPQIASLRDAAGNALFMSSANAGITNAPSGVLLGRPIRFTEKVPVLGAVGDLSLVDPGFYLNAVRSGVEIAVSEDFLFDTDQIAYRAKLRHDGQPALKAPYRMADGSSTQVSPFVRLGTP
jgi:HK97 family phage major capsid protein